MIKAITKVVSHMKSLFYVLLGLVLSSCAWTGYASPQKTLSWSYDEQTETYTNDQTGIVFPKNVNGFERVEVNLFDAGGSFFSSYQGEVDEIQVFLGSEVHPAVWGQMHSSVRKIFKYMTLREEYLQSFNYMTLGGYVAAGTYLWNEKREPLSEDLLEKALDVADGLEKVERLSFKRQVDGRDSQGFGFTGELEEGEEPLKRKVYPSFAIFEEDGFVYMFAGVFLSRDGIDDFMNFLDDLGIEKVVCYRLPKMRYQSPQKYPIKLKKEKVEGIVVVEFLVLKEGNVTWVKTIDSPDPRLSSLAEKRLLSSIFWPGIKNGFPSEYTLQMPISFGPKKKTASDDLVVSPVVLEGPGDRIPEPLYQPAPDHPRKLWTSEIEGEATIKFIVSGKGIVTSTEVISSSRSEFAKSAEETVMSWFFEPALKDGVPVACRMEVSFVFSIPGLSEDSGKRPLALGDLDRIPQPTYQEAPSHPRSLRNSHISGEVVVRFTITEEGDVIDAIALESSHPDFAAAAVEAISRWKFSPGIRNGVAVRCKMEIPIAFKISPAG